MPSALDRFFDRLADHAPPVVRERVLPVIRYRVLPAVRGSVRPACKLVVAYVVLQVIISQSATVQAAWTRVKALTPRPLHAAVSAVGRTSVGRTTMDATFAIRNGADRIFHPLHVIHARQQERGQAAGHGIMNIQNAIDEALTGLPRTPTVDEQMQQVETGRPPAPPDR
jgi:hypothetical protein